MGRRLRRRDIRVDGSRDRIALPVAGGVGIIPVTGIDWLESDGTTFHAYVHGYPRTVRRTASGVRFAARRALFRQIHRSTVVNI